ncbi:MAG: hypothetical protein ACK56F_27260, partial [bacterium]
HYINTPKHALARLDAEKLAAAKAEFLQLEKDGMVLRLDSPWSSPIHMVRKADRSWRPCGDFCHLNLVTIATPTQCPTCEILRARRLGALFI